MMRLVPKRQALQLTGLSPATLREWTSRRALVSADIPARKQGSSARFSWQTILVLRLAVILKDKFRLELQAHRSLFASVRQTLKKRSFVAMWDHALLLYSVDDWALIDTQKIGPIQSDVVIVRLNPHLEVLAIGFALHRPLGIVGQLDLFPVVAARDRPLEGLSRATVTEASDVLRRRHSA